LSGISPEQSTGIFYQTRVDDVMSHSAFTCRADTPVREMATQMRDNVVGSLVIVDEEGSPLGIVTERDLVYKALTGGHDSQDPQEQSPPSSLTAEDVMSSPPVTVHPSEFIYKATFLMMKNRCRRLVVVREDGQLAGMLSMRDLFRLQGYEARVITDQIGKSSGVDELCRLRSDIDGFIHKLFLGDVDGWSMSEILTDFNDAIVEQMLHLERKALRAEGFPSPRCSFAWLGFGSDGRREQVLRGDQDNGIVMEDGDCGPRAEEYFRALAGRVNEDLAAYGFDLCDGGVMAREDKYFGPLSAWRSRIRDMVHHAQDGSQLRDLTILLDCRCVRGDATLVERLWDYIIEETERIPVSVRSLGEDATGKPVPLNFLGRLQYERDQEGKRGLNVKKYGMLPLIAGVKAIAVDHGIRATSNVERINALGDLGALEKESAEDLLFAHEFFLRLKVQASAERVFHDQASTHFIYPEEWSSWEKDNLKKAFKAVDHLQTILRYHFVL